MNKRRILTICLIVLTVIVGGIAIYLGVKISQSSVDTLPQTGTPSGVTWTSYTCSGSCNSGSECNTYGNPPAGQMWSCWYNTSVAGYRCAYDTTNSGGDSCYLSCSSGWQSCGCDTSTCETSCLSQINAGESGTYTMKCANCGQKFTCSCSKPTTSIACGSTTLCTYDTDCESTTSSTFKTCDVGDKNCVTDTTRTLSVTCNNKVELNGYGTCGLNNTAVSQCGQYGYTQSGDCNCVKYNSVSETPTNTPTNTPTVTLTHTPTITVSTTPTITPTHSITVTPTHTPTVTPTISTTPTVTVTGTITVTVTKTTTVTPTGTTIPKTALITDDIDRVLVGFVLLTLGFALYRSGLYVNLGNLLWNKGGNQVWGGISNSGSAVNSTLTNTWESMLETQNSIDGFFMKIGFRFKALMRLISNFFMHSYDKITIFVLTIISGILSFTILVVKVFKRFGKLFTRKPKKTMTFEERIIEESQEE